MQTFKERWLCPSKVSVLTTIPLSYAQNFQLDSLLRLDLSPIAPNVILDLKDGNLEVYHVHDTRNQDASTSGDSPIDADGTSSAFEVS